VVLKPNLLFNVQRKNETPIQRQGFHIDLTLAERGFVVIAAVQKISLLVFPGTFQLALCIDREYRLVLLFSLYLR
jgi:hypothetical protein